MRKTKKPLFKGKKQQIAFIIFTVFAVLVMCVIFVFSAQSADKSNETSGGFIDAVLNVFYDGYDGITSQQKNELVSSFQGVVRSFAHGGIFLILGIMCSGALLQIEYKQPKIRMVYAWVICLIYAVSDEVHQYFVPGRAFQVSDITVDAIGAFLGVVILYMFNKVLLLWAKNIAKVNNLL